MVEEIQEEMVMVVIAEVVMMVVIIAVLLGCANTDRIITWFSEGL